MHLILRVLRQGMSCEWGVQGGACCNEVRISGFWTATLLLRWAGLSGTIDCRVLNSERKGEGGEMKSYMETHAKSGIQCLQFTANVPMLSWIS